MVEKLKGINLSKLVTVGMGGEGMSIQLERKIGGFLKNHNSSANILKGYGMTEVCATACLEFPFAKKTGSVGIPLVNNNVMIYDNDAATELTYGQTGEICMQCESEMVGYKGDPVEMEKLFRIHADGSRWLHTGDLGRMDDDGFLFIEGRIKRMITVLYEGAAYKVFPEPIEAQICKHPNVIEACVIGNKVVYNRLLHAYVVLNDESDKKEEQVENELRRQCEKTMSFHMCPSFYTFCDELPRTPAGKVDYRALEEMANSKR